MSDHLGELISAHLDGELSAGETAAVQAHLAECAECRRELEGTREVRDTMRAAAPVEPPFGFYERLVRGRGRGRDRRARWPVAASAIAVAAASIVLLGFAVTPPRAKVVPPVAAIRAKVATTNQIHVSVVRADVDWSQLQGGLRRQISGLPGEPWESTATSGPKALVYDDDGWVVMVVGNVSDDQLEQAARAAEGRTGESIVDHVRDAAAAVLDGFSLR